MRKLFIFAVALAAMFACTSKQDQFNEEVKAIMERNNNVGLALVAVNNGQVVLNETYGYKNLDTKEPIAKDDIFRIASISKSFFKIKSSVSTGRMSASAKVQIKLLKYR